MRLQTLNLTQLEQLEPMLNESIYHFLAEYQKGMSDFSELGSIFFRLIQTMTDPPLEFIWFYSALTFHTCKSSSVRDSMKEVLIAKDLFHSLVSFSSSSDNCLKKAAILAPLLYQLVNLKCEISSFKTEIEGLVDAVVSHVIMCSCNDFAEEEVGFDKSRVSWAGLVPVWIVDRVGGDHGCVDGLRLFFPLSSDEIRRGMDVDCGMAYLAGVVMIESLLLRLCLMFNLRVPSKEFEKDVSSSAAQIIKGFTKNSAFLVTLLKLLLEPCLPVAELLTCTDELFLRKILFDVILELCWFLGSDSSTQLPDNRFKEIAILWLFVADSALQFARENGDDATRGDCYLKAFSASRFRTQIITWVTSQSNVNLNTSDISTPKDLITWLLVLEKQGLKVCDLSISRLYEKAAKRKSKALDQKNKSVTDNGKKEETVVRRDQEMVESSADTTFASPTSINGRRKRDSEEVERQIKLVKYSSREHFENDGYCSKSEMGNPVPDQEMVDMIR